VDLCDTTLSFNSLIPLKNDDSVLVNLSVFDICFPYTPTWGTIEILVKSNDEIRVDMKYTTLDSVHHFVLGELRGIIQDQRLNGEVVFKLEWRDASQKTIKEVVAKSISALQQFILEETQETYGMNLHALDEKDFLKLKKNFYFEIALTQVRPDLPVDIGN
jgi:RNA processing factor Prp31